MSPCFFFIPILSKVAGAFFLTSQTKLYIMILTYDLSSCFFIRLLYLCEQGRFFIVFTYSALSSLTKWEIIILYNDKPLLLPLLAQKPKR